MAGGIAGRIVLIILPSREPEYKTVGGQGSVQSLIFFWYMMVPLNFCHEDFNALHTMTMDLTILDRVVALIESDPRAGQALLLYGLVSTLDTEKGGCLYRLTKLSDMTADNRRLAYGLMELAACGGTGGPPWQAAVARIEGAIRGG